MNSNSLYESFETEFDSDFNLETDKYAEYEAIFDPLQTDRQARRKRKPKVKHVPKKSQEEVINELAEDISTLESGFQITYTPARYEEQWLISSLSTFYEQGVLKDVMALIKGGKEASVYRCLAESAYVEANGGDSDLIAAKVYRPRQFRNLRNDKMYREGRSILTPDGSAVNERDQRLMRAVGQRTAFGAEVAHTSWLMHEYKAMEQLYKAGAAVPQPFAAGENSILMTYCGDERVGAPALNEIGLEQDEATALLYEVMRNIELMLQHNMVHGDLSAYNILYWQGKITIIDFPQVTHSQNNSKAYSILKRDITRVCEYFQQQGVQCNPNSMTERLWSMYAARDPYDKAADASWDLDVEVPE